MIVANLATFPSREHLLADVVQRLAPQVDRLNVVLNEYENVPPSAPQLEQVNYILPDEDTKDVGKFFPDTTGASYVVLLDDDFVYPTDFVAKSVAALENTGLSPVLGGYHCSIYTRPGVPRNLTDLKRTVRFYTTRRQIARFRHVFGFIHEVSQPILVDQVGTAAAIMSGASVPPYEYMRTSKKFVDVRLARWCYEQGIERVRLPAPANWINSVMTDETISSSFTQKHHAHVADEIWSYAFKTANRGATV